MAKRPEIELTKEIVDAAGTRAIWNETNDWLYKLCDRYPKHTDVAQIAAKITLIGRAYSAAAERGVSGKGKSEEYIIELSKRFIKKNADKHLQRLPRRPADLRHYLHLVIDVHHAIESVFSNDGELGRVSLTSKYLHFHRRDLFPMFDSRAAKAITKVTPDCRFIGYKLPRKYASLPYAKFCARCAWLLDAIHRLIGKTATLRDLDNVLLQVHRSIGKDKR